MKASRMLKAPAALLLDPDLTPAAKLVALFPSSGTSELARRTGLARQTILAGRD